MVTAVVIYLLLVFTCQLLGDYRFTTTITYQLHTTTITYQVIFHPNSIIHGQISSQVLGLLKYVEKFMYSSLTISWSLLAPMGPPP